MLKLSGEHVSRAVKMFASVLKYQGDTGEALDDVQRIDIAQKLLHQGLKRLELKDELYMQLVKQTRGNPGPVSREKAWELFYVVASAMPPSKVHMGPEASAGAMCSNERTSERIVVSHGRAGRPSSQKI